PTATWQGEDECSGSSYAKTGTDRLWHPKTSSSIRPATGYMSLLRTVGADGIYGPHQSIMFINISCSQLEMVQPLFADRLGVAPPVVVERASVRFSSHRDLSDSVIGVQTISDGLALGTCAICSGQANLPS